MLVSFHLFCSSFFTKFEGRIFHDCFIPFLIHFCNFLRFLANDGLYPTVAQPNFAVSEDVVEHSGGKLGARKPLCLVLASPDQL